MKDSKEFNERIGEGKVFIKITIDIPIDAFKIIQLVAGQLYDEPIEEVTRRMLLTEFEYLLKDRAYLFNMDPSVAADLESMQPHFTEILRKANVDSRK